MTVSSEVGRNDYIGNGSTASYDFTFKVFEDADLLVVVVDADGAETELTLGTHYAVTGAGEAAGGSIALVAGFDWMDASGFLSTGYTLSILRDLEIVQETDLKNQGRYYAEDVEAVADRSRMIDLQQQEQIDRSLQAPRGEPGSAAARTLPTVANRASMYLAFDADGNPMASPGTNGVAASTFGATLVDDADEAAARATLGGVIPSVLNLAALKALSGTNLAGYVQMAGYATAGDGGQGLFRWVAADAATANDGTIVQPTAGGGRFYRMFAGEINVRWFGAVGDGVIDDGARFLAAVNAAVTAGRPLYVPAGTFLLTTWTAPNLTGELVLRGDGNTLSIIRGPSTSTDFVNVRAGVTARGIKFKTFRQVFDFSSLSGTRQARIEGCAFDTFNRALYWDTASPDANTLRQVRVTDSWFTGSLSDCIDIDGAVSVVVVRNNLFETVKGSAMIIGRDVVASHDLWHEVTFSDNDIDGMTAISASDSTTGILVYGRKLQAHNNRMKDFVGGASNELWGIYTKCRQVVTAGNTFENFTTAGVGPYMINIKGDNEAATDSTPAGYNHVVANNQILQQGSADGKGTGIRLYNEDVLVTGNKVRGCLIGIESTSSPSHRRKMIVGNMIEGPALSGGLTVASTFGMSLSIDGGEVEVKSNTIRNCRIGIRPTTTGTCDRFDIVGNTFLMPTAAENHIDSNQTGTFSNVTINGNIFHNGARALSLSSTGTWTGLTYANNDHRGVTDAWSFGTSIVLTKVNIRGNVGMTYATTDATNQAKLSIPVPELQGYAHTYRVTGMSTDHTVRGDYKSEGYTYRQAAGTATLVKTDTTLNETDAGLDAVPAIVSNAINWRFTGKAATNMVWALDITVTSTN